MKSSKTVIQYEMISSTVIIAVVIQQRVYAYDPHVINNYIQL